MVKKKKGQEWVEHWGKDRSAIMLRKKIGPGALVLFTPGKAKKEKRMLTRIAIVREIFDGNGPKKGKQMVGVETRCDMQGKHDGTIRKKGEETFYFKGAPGKCDFWMAKDVKEVLMSAEELGQQSGTRKTYTESKEKRQSEITVGDYVAVNKQPLGLVKAVEWIKRTGRTGEWLAVQVDCKIDRARSSDITEIFFTDPSTAEYLDKKITGCWDPSDEERKNAQTVYPHCHAGECLPEGEDDSNPFDPKSRGQLKYPDGWVDAKFQAQYLKQPYKWNFSDIVKQEDKYDKALKNLQNAVKAKIDLQREKLERTMREKVSFKRDQFEEEERILKMKIDERQETIDKYQLRLSKDLLMTQSQREDINREIEKILADKRQMQQDLRRFQIHSEEECLLLHHDHAKHLRHEMTTALAADLKREVDRKKQRMRSQRNEDLPKFREEQEDEWDEPTDKALREVEILKAENAEVMKALQAISEELGTVAKENQQILRKLKCIPADDVDDFETPGGDYYKGQTGFSSDEEDPLGDLEDLMDLSGVRQNAINLVNTLIGDDGNLDGYGGDTLGGYGDTPAGDDFGTGSGYDFGDGGAGHYGGDDLDDLLGDFDKGLNDDEF